MPPAPPPHGRASWGRLRYSLASFVEMSDWPSRLRLLGMKLEGRLLGPRRKAASVRVRELDGGELYVRPGTADMNTIVLDYMQGAHLPPRALVGEDLSQLVELGSQVGTGLAGLAARYPHAQVLGVEPDPANAALARRNVAPFGERCEVVETAIWDDSETELIVEGDWTSGYTVRPVAPGDPPDRRVHSTTVDRLLEEHMPEAEIDYVTMSLEPIEPRVLEAASGWAGRVRSIRCEINPGIGFGGDECVRLLERLGFDAWWEPGPSHGWAFGVRRSQIELRGRG